MKDVVRTIIIILFFLSPSYCWAQGKVTRHTPTKEIISKKKKNSTGKENGHDWVDLGLPSGLKWATCNLGASTPSGYGSYYAWGEISPKSDYNTWSNCFDCRNEAGTNWGIYKIGGDTQITPSSGHDAARMNWGGTWRMPTATEFQELVDKCKWVWVNKDGHNGYLVTGPNGMSIFLPAAGWKGGSGEIEIGKTGHYWSSTLYQYLDRYKEYFGDSQGATVLGFGDRFSTTVDQSYRKSGKSIRPVMK